MPAVGFRFNGKNARAQRVAERQAAAMVKDIAETTRAGIRSTVARMIASDVSPRDAVEIIEDLVGLTDRQSQAAMTYRDELEEQGYDEDDIDDRLEEYSEKGIRSRAETIARTEVMDALNDGALEGWKQAQDEGLLGDDAQKYVIPTADEVLAKCPTCSPFADDPQERALDEPFDVDGEEFMAPPFHPRCRCTMGVNPGSGSSSVEEDDPEEVSTE